MTLPKNEESPEWQKLTRAASEAYPPRIDVRARVRAELERRDEQAGISLADALIELCGLRPLRAGIACSLVASIVLAGVSWSALQQVSANPLFVVINNEAQVLSISP